MYRFGNAWKRSMIDSIHAPDLEQVKLCAGSRFLSCYQRNMEEVEDWLV